MCDGARLNTVKVVFTRFSPQLKLCGLSDSDKIANYLHVK